ncbi:WAT1-related protein At1g21890-like [Magnolia sinica]|uniref:WAT1-related protein At1g21890-like n=1 Tax=Magnolia sinica TaxID=86752 RepID=UPI002658A1B3|nr:WAT1-related protein At1g21890-like [Magnolia sinica]
MEGQNPSGSFSGVFRKLKPYLAMISLQFGYAGLHIVTVLCLKGGMNHYVLVVYRHAVATAVIAPFAFLLERKVRPKMTISTFLKIMLLGLLEPVIDQNLYYVGLTYTSATFASALFNILPAITFIMAIICRLEKVKIKELSSQAKVAGTVLTVAGAMVMTVYKGPILNLLGLRHVHHETASMGADQNWLKGTFMIIGSCTGWSAFFIVQSFTLKAYPAELSLTALICVMGMVQGAAVALVMERGAAVWSIGWDTRLLGPVYSGIVCSGIAYYVQGIVMKERGPVFVTAFNPLCMVIVAVLGSLILSEELRLGRVIGAIIIVIGLYSVVWGKSKDPLESAPSVDKKKGALELPTAMIDVGKTTSHDHLTGGIVVENPPRDTLSLK